ncbi:hypothetical protein [Curtobacterium sp. JUb34]|uniref:hypothetical protein n=1 Tax=Curtobacterium sp. JUb34 TaxID=2485109 RepID=UPI00161D1A8B|nr:hypothetical protein [Curtobacterium sp. JUb34]
MEEQSREVLMHVADVRLRGETDVPAGIQTRHRDEMSVLSKGGRLPLLRDVDIPYDLERHISRRMPDDGVDHAVHAAVLETVHRNAQLGRHNLPRPALLRELTISITLVRHSAHAHLKPR